MVNHREPLLHAVLAGVGVILQPLELVCEALQDGRLVELPSGYQIPTRSLHVLYAPDRRIAPKLRSFLNFAVEVFGR